VALTAILAGLAQLGFTGHHASAFDTLSLKTGGATDAMAARAVDGRQPAQSLG
jgi:glycine dehydrogenase